MWMPYEEFLIAFAQQKVQYSIRVESPQFFHHCGREYYIADEGGLNDQDFQCLFILRANFKKKKKEFG